MAHVDPESSIFEIARLHAETFVRQIEYHRELPSTSDLALRLAAIDSTRTPLLVLTDSQTSGRGRGMNRWWSARGGLAMSLVLEPLAKTWPLQRWPQISLATALAVRDSIQELAPRAVCGVKWPNDVFLDGRKVAGILLESTLRPPPRCVIGIGVNVNNSLTQAPTELQGSATALCDVVGQQFDRTEALVRILQSLEQWLCKSVVQGQSLSESWRPHCALFGRAVRIDAGQRQVSGVCQGIDDDGALLVVTETGLERCHAGTVAMVEGENRFCR